MGLINNSHFELNADNGPLMIRVAISMMVISLLGTILRFLARRIVRQPFMWDDWFILLGLMCSWGVCIIQIIAVKYGTYGQHIQHATQSTLLHFFKALYGVQIVYPFGIAFIKFSILLFYRRLFKVQQAKMPLITLGAVVLAWLIAMIFCGVFSCTPVYAFWNREEGKCIDDVKYYMGVAIPNVVTDIALLIFPVPIIWNLKISKSNRIALLGIFLIGGFIVVISSLRLVTVLQANGDPDITWSLVPLGIFNAVELNVGILCACLPSMTPLLRLMLGKKLAGTKAAVSQETQKMADSHKRWLKSNNISLNTADESLTWLKDASYNETGGHTFTKTSVSGPGHDGIELGHVTKPSGQIHIEKNITWS